MERFLAVDSGKMATKVATYDAANKRILKAQFRTKISEGNMEDDDLEKGTCVVEIDGVCYKVGNGAMEEAELETTKATEIHRICTLTAIAKYVSSNEVDLVHVAIGLPITEYSDCKKRLAYKDFILPKLERNEKEEKASGRLAYIPSEVITVRYKGNSDALPVEKKFRIASKAVYAESAGVLYSDAVRFSNGTTAVIDIGNLNINGTCWDNFENDKKSNFCCELGGKSLISGLSSFLSTKYGRFNESQTTKMLKGPRENRKLVPSIITDENRNVEEESAKEIKKYLLNYVKDIKQQCAGRQWSIGYMQFAFIGGTTELIREEIREVFGDVYIPEQPEFANVIGFLKLMYTKRTGTGMEIAKRKVEESQTENKGEK